MQVKRIGLRIALTIGLGSSALVALGCSDDDGGSGNQACESACVEDYLGTVDSCEDETTDCMTDCTSPDDTSCMGECEVIMHECEFEMSACMAGCPCNDALSNCAAGCDYDDSGCLNACHDKHLECTGGDSVYDSTTACGMQKLECLSGCEAEADTDGYLDCRAGCHQAYTGCLSDCV